MCSRTTGLLSQTLVSLPSVRAPLLEPLEAWISTLLLWTYRSDTWSGYTMALMDDPLDRAKICSTHDTFGAYWSSTPTEPFEEPMENLINYRQLLVPGSGDFLRPSPFTYYSLRLWHGHTTCISLPSDSFCRLIGLHPRLCQLRNHTQGLNELPRPVLSWILCCRCS